VAGPSVCVEDTAMWEIERLEAAAWALRDQANRLDHSEWAVRCRVKQACESGRWQGKSATNYWHAAEERYGRMWHTRDRMRDLAAKFDAQVKQLRAKADQQRLAQRHLA
jgi:hypothetical protein